MDQTLLDEVFPEYHAPSPQQEPTPSAPTPSPKRVRTGLSRSRAALVAVAVLSGGTAAVGTHALDGRGASTVYSPTVASAKARTLSGKTLDVAQVVAAVGPSVVSIRTQISNGFQSGSAAGTGVIISSDGEVMTNAHVVEGATVVKVTLAGESQARDAEIIGADAANDLALLKVAGVSNLPVAELGKSSDVRVGDDVVAIGNALALKGGPTVTRGIISALDRTLETEEATMTGLIQTDASISSGNSGGPLVDATGKVIGINSAVAASGQGESAENIGFAIAIDNARPVLDRLRNHTAAAEAGYLGVRTADPTDGSHGATIVSVEAGSAAEKAGLQAGDLVTAVDGKSVDGAAALGAAIKSHTPGSPITITFIRDNRERTVTADLTQRTN